MERALRDIVVSASSREFKLPGIIRQVVPPVPVVIPLKLYFYVSYMYFMHDSQNNNTASKGETRSPSPIPLTPIRRRYSHTLLSTMFKACSFVLVG